MKLKIGERTYDAATLDRLTLREILRLEQETAALGRPMKWSEIREIVDAVEGMDLEDFDSYDEAPWVVALVVYAARLRAGENISFADAVDFPIGDLEMIFEETDTEAAQQDPRRARPADHLPAARASKRAPARAKKTSTKKSPRG